MRHIACFLLGVAAILASFPAFAQGCYPRAAIVEGISEQYGEVMRMQAMTTRGRVMEMFVAPSGSWTMILSRPDGTSCPVASGHGVEMPAPTEGDPA